jgi:hypothetical protein
LFVTALTVWIPPWVIGPILWFVAPDWFQAGVELTVVVAFLAGAVVYGRAERRQRARRRAEHAAEAERWEAELERRDAEMRRRERAIG